MSVWVPLSFSMNSQKQNLSKWDRYTLNFQQTKEEKHWNDKKGRWFYTVNKHRAYKYCYKSML